jgi:hypothetical protein
MLVIPAMLVVNKVSGEKAVLIVSDRRSRRYIKSTGNGKGHAAGGAVVEALRYKPEGRWIDSRWCHWNFSLT